MRGLVLAALTALAVAAATPALAQDAKHSTPAGGNVTPSDQIIQQLTFRNLKLATSDPRGSEQMPAVGLDIKFKRNSAELTDQAKEQIRQLADAIKSDQLAGYRFRVEGHTDSTGRAGRNMLLSQHRAEAVKDHLAAAYGIPRGRLEAVGRGQTMPINAADPANPANRRVQVVNLGQ
jgi:outer membrane protein OmpA-like peptidoglycan-associated protein